MTRATDDDAAIELGRSAATAYRKRMAMIDAEMSRRRISRAEAFLNDLTRPARFERAPRVRRAELRRPTWTWSRPKLFRWVVGACGAALMFASVTYSPVPVGAGGIAAIPSSTVDAAQRRLACHATAAIRDGDATLRGVVRLDPAPECRNAILSRPFDDAEALRVAEAIGVLEGDWRVSGTIGGSVPRKHFQAVLHRVNAAIIRRFDDEVDRMETIFEHPFLFVPYAGSSPLQSTFEQLIGQDAGIDSVREKLRLMMHGLIFIAREGRSDLERAHLIAAGMRMAISGPGDSLGGALAAEFLFGDEPIGLGEACLLAGAVKHAPSANDGTVSERLNKTKERARTCIGKLAASEAANEMMKARAVVARFTMPDPIDLARRDSVALTSQRAAAIFGGGHASTIDPNAQDIARGAVGKVLASIEGALQSDQCLASDRNCPRPVDWLVAVAEIDYGELPLRVVLTNAPDTLFGRVVTTSNKPTVIPPPFGFGSQAKVPLALLAARGNGTLCNRVIGDLTSTSGPPPVQRCTDEIGHVSIEEAFARSMNNPFVDLVQSNQEAARDLYVTTGFEGVREADPRGLTLGYATRVPPSALMGTFAALTRAKTGQPALTVGVTPFAGGRGQGIDLSRHSADAGEAARFLAAPVVRTIGTLARLPKMLPPETRVLMGKTGTSETPDKRTRGKSLTAVVAYPNGQQFVVFASVTATDGISHVDGLRTQNVIALAAAGLSGLYTN
ncbi:MAG: hypothetical protein ACU0CI_06340 [Shimia sp.]